MRIGIYAGSFNPVHSVHMKIARLFVEQDLLDKVIFVPVGDAYEKKGLEQGKHRYEMISIAISDNDKFLVSDIEIKHKCLSTFKTMELFSNCYPDDEVILILGADNLKEIYWWDNSDELIHNYKIFVMTRNGLHASDFPEYKDNPNIIFINFDIDMSATSVRRDILEKRYDDAIQKLPNGVFDYILKNNLYGVNDEIN